jgi:hypothetical protein
MSENGEAQKVAESPKCVYCDANPMAICSKQLVAANGLVIGLVWCSSCAALYSAQPIGMQQPVQLPHLKGKPGLII